MFYLSIPFVVLTLFPVIVASIFRVALVERKQKETLDDLRQLQAYETDLVKGWGGEEGIRAEIGKYYGLGSLALPALLLTFFYAVGFLVCAIYLATFLLGASPEPFSRDFLLAARPVLIAFLGVYLFNTGTTVRRLYLADLTEQVFWSGVNRYLLTIGLAVLLATVYKLGSDPDQEIGRFYYILFFVIGFLANEYLHWAMEQAIRLLKLRQPRTPDLGLQMIQGINIWKEHRLEEEGIENVQNLATADVITLTIKTHYNLRTLVDWVDQAILLDRLGGEKARILATEGLIAGAIDLAWKAPGNTGDSTMSKVIADKLKLEQPFVEALMNSLYEDAYIRTLWTLWQTREEFKPVSQGA